MRGITAVKQDRHGPGAACVPQDRLAICNPSTNPSTLPLLERETSLDTTSPELSQLR